METQTATDASAAITSSLPAPDMGKSLMGQLDTAINQFQQSQAAAQEAPKETPIEKTVEKVEVVEDPTPKEDKPSKKLKDFDNPWEASVGDEEKPAEKKEDGEAPEPELKTPAQKNAWTALKAEAKELKELKPQYEALKKQLEEAQQATTKLTPELEAKIARAEQIEAAYALEETKEYQEAVTAPMMETKSTLDQVAEYAGIEARALYDALDEPNAFKRAAMIRKALTSSENEVGEDAINMAVQSANDFHKSVVPEMKRLKENALEIQRSLQGQKTAEAARMSEKQQAEMKAASTEIFTKLQTNLGKIPGLFDDERVATAMQNASLANPAEKPMMAAYQAQAAAVMPYMIQTINGLLTQISSLQKVAQSRSGAVASPSEANRQGPAPKQGADGGKSLLAGLSELGIR